MNESKPVSTPEDSWKEAVIEACVIACIGWDENDPEGTLRRLLQWESQIALDPAVSPAARALVDQGRASVATGVTTRDNGTSAYAVTNDVYWRYTPPPIGTKLFLLNPGGVAITGQWVNNTGLLGWHPLFKRDKSLEGKLP